MMTPHKKIQEILDKCPKDNCIFRGENKKYDKISSGLYRKYCQSDNGNSTNDRNPLIDNDNFSILEVEKDIVEEVKKHIRIDALNIEVLTELQHHGEKTALIDFSKNVHIALFFACDGNFKKDGRVILLKTSKTSKKEDIDYESLDRNEGEHIGILISAAGKSPRVIFQSSIFVRASRGYLAEDSCEIIEIENKIKKPLLEYLNKYFNINTETIYNDTQGFISNQHNYSNSIIEFYRGWTKQEEGKHEEAIEHYNKAIKLNPQLYEAYNNRGMAKNTLAKAIKEDVKKNALAKEAIKNYDKAIELNPKYANAYYNRGIAKNTLAKAIKEDVKKNALVKEVIEDYDKAIELNPKDAEAYNNRGNANATLDNCDKAIKDYDKAIEHNSKYAKAYNNRGTANATLGNYEEAIKDYSKAIEYNSKYADAYNNRGNTKNALGRYKEAIKDCDKAIELNPKHAKAYYNRGNAKNNLAKTIKEDVKKNALVKEAIKDYNKAIEHNPKYANAYNNRGIANSNLGEYTKAIADYTEAKKLFEKKGEVRMVEICEQKIERLKKLMTNKQNL